MRNAVLAACLVCLVAAGISTVSAGDQDFTLRNRTGYTIEQVYVSPSNDNSWGEDVLGKDVMRDGASTDITFSRKETACKWDLKVVFDDDEDAIWEDFDLCSISEITLRYEGKRPTATWK
jgi:hypothetical protein